MKRILDGMRLFFSDNEFYCQRKWLRIADIILTSIGWIIPYQDTFCDSNLSEISSKFIGMRKFTRRGSIRIKTVPFTWLESFSSLLFPISMPINATIFFVYKNYSKRTKDSRNSNPNEPEAIGRRWILNGTWYRKVKSSVASAVWKHGLNPLGQCLLR